MTDSETAPPRTTISEVARSAGVSLPTVSKVLNGRPGVSRPPPASASQGCSPRTASCPAGHRVKPAARSSWCWASSESPWALSIVRAMENAAYAEGLGVTLPGSARPPGRLVEHALVTAAPPGGRLRRRRDQPAAQTGFVSWTPRGHRPGRKPTEYRSRPSGIAHWRGALDATNYLIGLGHRDIATIGGPLRLLCSRARVDGSARR